MFGIFWRLVMKKYSFIMVLMFLMAFFVSGYCFAEKKTVLVVPGDRVGHLKLGMTQKQVLKVLGKPDKVLAMKKVGALAFDYKEKYNMLIQLDVKKKFVNKIGVVFKKDSPFDYRLKNGLTFLAGFDKVKSVMGEAKLKPAGKSGKLDRFIASYPKQGIEFEFVKIKGNIGGKEREAMVLFVIDIMKKRAK